MLARGRVKSSSSTGGGHSSSDIVIWISIWRLRKNNKNTDSWNWIIVTKLTTPFDGPLAVLFTRGRHFFASPWVRISENPSLSCSWMQLSTVKLQFSWWCTTCVWKTVVSTSIQWIRDETKSAPPECCCCNSHSISVADDLGNLPISWLSCVWFGIYHLHCVVYRLFYILAENYCLPTGQSLSGKSVLSSNQDLVDPLGTHKVTRNCKPASR